MSSMKYPYRDLGVPFDRKFRNDLNANFDDIEHDIRMIGGEAAQQALEAAEEANTQAIYAQTSGDYANDKGDYAAQQGDYAQTQGNFANEKGLYAQQQGDYAKAQGDYAKQVGDENKTRWLNPVATFADIATTYPNPQHGDTVMVTDDGENSGSVYRYENGQWNLTQKHNDLAIADVQNKIGILSKRTECVSIKELGAIGDGSDATAYFQTALNEHNYIFVNEGVYEVDGSVLAFQKNNITIFGIPGKSIIKLKNSAQASDYHEALVFKECNNIHIYGLTFQGNYLYDMLEVGIRLKGVDGALIEKCVFDKLNYGIDTWYDESWDEWKVIGSTTEYKMTKNVTVRKCKFIDSKEGTSSGYGITFSPCENGRVYDNEFYNMGRHAVYLRRGAKNCIVEDNIMEGTIQHSMINVYSTTQSGYKDEPTAYGNIIRKNTIRNAFTSGINVSNFAEENIIENNIIENCVAQGINVDYEATKNTLRFNIIKGCPEPIRFAQSTTKGNAVYGNTIYTTSSGNTVIDNGANDEYDNIIVYTDQSNYRVRRERKLLNTNGDLFLWNNGDNAYPTGWNGNSSAIPSKSTDVPDASVNYSIEISDSSTSYEGIVDFTISDSNLIGRTFVVEFWVKKISGTDNNFSFNIQRRNSGTFISNLINITSDALPIGVWTKKKYKVSIPTDAGNETYVRLRPTAQVASDVGVIRIAKMRIYSM